MSGKVLHAGKLAVAVTLMALLWSRLDGAETWRLIARASPIWLLAALASLAVQTGLSALRWQVTARLYGLRIGAGKAVSEYFLAQFVNQSLPGGVLGDVGRAVRAQSAGSLLNAGQSVVFERLWGQIALLAVMLAAVAAVTWAPGGLTLPGLLVSSVGWVAAIAVLAMLALATAPALPGAPGRAAARLAAAARRGLLSRSTRTAQAALSLGTVAANLAAFAFCARATGTVLPLAAVLTLVPVILFTMVVPLSVSGWGLRESAAAALFPLAGATPEAGLAASIAFGLIFLASALPGLAVLLLQRPPAPVGAPAVAPAPSAPKLETTRS